MRNAFSMPLIAFACLTLLISSCGKEEIATCNDGIRNGNEIGVDCGGSCAPCPVDPTTLRGVVQKGPFLNGSSVLLNELDSNYVQTGISFNTQILENNGTFSFLTIPLASPYVSLRADGFYFNEVTGDNSTTQITLNAISDIPTDGTINVNVLTHLEKARVEYLLASNPALGFLAAKAQAQSEILAMFNISTSAPLDRAETLNIANNSEGDAILIAVASILQGYRSENDFSDLMAGIISDLRTDGILNNVDLQTELVAHAKVLDTNSVRQNIIDRYNELGITANVPQFGSYLTGFLTTTSFPSTGEAITYPAMGNTSLNLLDPTTVTGPIPPGSSSSLHLRATLPAGCPGLRITISKTDVLPCGSCCICDILGTGEGWDWPFSNFGAPTKTYTNIAGETELDLLLTFNPGTYLIEYFENPSNVPTKTKTLVVN